MRQAQRRFQFNSLAALNPRVPNVLSLHLPVQAACSPFSILYSLFVPIRPLFPIPYSLALCYNRRAVERTAKWEQPGSMPSRHRPQLNPLRLCRAVRVSSLVLKILRGIVPPARSGWSRGAASCSVPRAAITCPGRTILSRAVI